MSDLNSDSVKKLISECKISIVPYVDSHQGPNLYYCHLGDNILIPANGVVVDSKKLPKNFYKKVKVNTFYDLKPGEFILAETYESFSTDDSYALRLLNSSSLARLGISQCALGMMNPGCGKYKPVRLTLELVNNSSNTIRLYSTKIKQKNGSIEWGTEVLKVAVVPHETVTQSYSDWKGSLYGSDTGVTGSKIDKRNIRDGNDE